MDVQCLRHVLKAEPMEIADRLDLRVRGKEGISSQVSGLGNLIAVGLVTEL